jgi:hypothetical protein
MRSRILPRHEWGRLAAGPVADSGLASLIDHLDPRDVEIRVVEDGAGEIVGCVSLLRLTHLEGAWIDPRYRGNPGVGRRLYREAMSAARKVPGWVLASSMTGCIQRLLERLGAVALPVNKWARGYALDVKEGSKWHRSRR